MGGGGVGGRVGGWGGQGGCERRSGGFVKIQKTNIFLGGVGSRWEGASCWGVRVDVNGEVKFFCENSKKKIYIYFIFFLGGGVRSRVGVGEEGSKVWGRWVMWGMGDVNQE